jgi:hypothetical protein
MNPIAYHRSITASDVNALASVGGYDGVGL